MKLVVTVVGVDRVGIIAGVSTVLADHGVNIMSINQTILDGVFNMIMMCETKSEDIKDLTSIQEALTTPVSYTHLYWPLVLNLIVGQTIPAVLGSILVKALISRPSMAALLGAFK